MIVWREKFVAFAIHFLVTALLAACAAALIFFIWFPDPFQTMMGGTELFGLIVGCDLALGPLVSLVIYNSRKPRKELILDYTIVGIVQLAALTYGVYVMSNARPVYVAHVKDRLEVVTPADIEPEELEAADGEYRSLPKWGPVLVATRVPPEEANEALFTALEGKDVSLRPRYYVHYASDLEQIVGNAKPIEELKQRHPAAVPLITEALEGLNVPEGRLAYMPVKLRRAFWTALIDTDTGYPVSYIELDPY